MFLHSFIFTDADADVDVEAGEVRTIIGMAMATGAAITTAIGITTGIIMTATLRIIDSLVVSGPSPLLRTRSIKDLMCVR